MVRGRLEEAADRSEILDLAMRSMVYRDRGDWDQLIKCFHPDARLVTSWFEGNAHQFILDLPLHDAWARSRRQSKTHRR